MAIKKDFTVTFWIRNSNNPGWNLKDSDINFPPFTINEGIRVFFFKVKSYFTVCVLHPEIGYRKIKTDVTNYLGKDTFVAFTNDKDFSKLYLNGELAASIKKTSLLKEIEPGDFVMVKLKSGDIPDIAIDNKNVSVILEAKVAKINGKNVDLYFYNINKNKLLPKTRIVVE